MSCLDHPTHIEHNKKYNYNILNIFNYTLYSQYYNKGKTSRYKKLFDNIENITICPKITIRDIISYEFSEYTYKDGILTLDIIVEDCLNTYFEFYGWERIDDYNFKAKNTIIYNLDEYIEINNVDDNKYTMHYNAKDFYSSDRNHYIGFIDYENTNILSDYLSYENNSIFKELFEQEISIDPINTIEQIKKYYSDVIYEYNKEDNTIKIKRKELNKWNKPLEALFKFYGWYPKDKKTLYPKYKILDLHKYILEHKKIRLCVIGSKSFNDINRLKKSINEIVDTNDYECVKFLWDNEHVDLYKQYKDHVYGNEADYHKYGKKAKYIRNEEMIRNTDICVFFDDDNEINNDIIYLCKKYNKTYYKC